MKAITLGYKDAAGLTEPVVVNGPEADVNDQFTELADAQTRHEFPAEIKRLELYVLPDPIEVAIFISDDVTKFSQQSDNRRQAEIEKQRAEAKLERDAADNIGKAHKLFQAAAQARNVAEAAVACPPPLKRRRISPEFTSGTRLRATR